MSVYSSVIFKKQAEFNIFLNIIFLMENRFQQ